MSDFPGSFSPPGSTDVLISYELWGVQYTLCHVSLLLTKLIFMVRDREARGNNTHSSIIIEHWHIITDIERVFRVAVCCAS